MDFYFYLPLYRQFPTKTGLFMLNYTTCRLLQSFHISCSYNMSYVITFDTWEVKIMSYSLVDLRNLVHKNNDNLFNRGLGAQKFCFGINTIKPSLRYCYVIVCCSRIALQEVNM